MIFTWNEFFLAVNLTSRDASPVSVYVSTFKAAQGDLFIAKMSAAATAAVIPRIDSGLGRAEATRHRLDDGCYQVIAAQIHSPLEAKVLDAAVTPKSAPTTCSSKSKMPASAARPTSTSGTALTPLLSTPSSPGHEFSGVVAAVGDRVTGFKKGDPRDRRPEPALLPCAFCQRRQFNQCLNWRFWV